jgi:hypothetical protein
MTTQATGTMAALRANEAFAPWLDELEQVEPPPEPVRLPEGPELDDALDTMAIPEEDRPAMLAQRAHIEADPDLWWLLERSVSFLLRHMDSPAKVPDFPALPGDLGEVARFFHAWVYVAMLPHTRALYRTRGIPDDVLAATMADVGRHFTIHRARHETGGMAGQDWLMQHARGVIYQLGRLQFARAQLGGSTSRGMQAAGIACEQGEPALGVHIPGYLGPFPPEACDASFAQARAFFTRHYPAERYRFATCHSWLLDPQLADYLPPTSNIIQFQQRFRSAYTPDYGDRGTLDFVFRGPDRPLDELPQRTTLERAVVKHLRDGKHWHGGAGWLSFDPPLGKEHVR